MIVEKERDIYNTGGEVYEMGEAAACDDTGSCWYCFMCVRAYCSA